MATQQESLFQSLTGHTGGEELVPMPITRAGPAFRFSQSSTLGSLLKGLERMMKMSTSFPVTCGNLLPSKE